MSLTVTILIKCISLSASFLLSMLVLDKRQIPLLYTLSIQRTSGVLSFYLCGRFCCSYTLVFQIVCM